MAGMSGPAHLRRVWTAAALLLAAGLAGCDAPPQPQRGAARVIDGDTLDLGARRLRLHGIDAPEIDQTCRRADGSDWPCGRAARDRLAALVAGLEVACVARGRDSYGRTIATCDAGGRDLGESMVGEGLAWAYVHFSRVYAGTESTARDAGLGIWQGEAEAAWDYRRHDWKAASGTIPQPACPIKGNITAAGERVYHTPASPWYARTGIDTAAGEAWFCDEAEAQAAGWRPAGGKQ